MTKNLEEHFDSKSNLNITQTYLQNITSQIALNITTALKNLIILSTKQYLIKSNSTSKSASENETHIFTDFSTNQPFLELNSLLETNSTNPLKSKAEPEDWS